MRIYLVRHGKAADEGYSIDEHRPLTDDGRALMRRNAKAWSKRSGPAPELWINPTDAADRAIRPGDGIELFNERGRAAARARVTDDVPPGVVWMRDGWVAVNRLTSNEPCMTPEAATALPIPGGKAAYEALVEVRRGG